MSSDQALTQPTCKSVQFDGLPLLRIIKHCRERSPEIVSGNLYGMVNNGVLEITNSSSQASEYEPDTELTSVQQDTPTTYTKCSHIGVYTTEFNHEQLLDIDTIHEIVLNQLENPERILVTYDPQQTTNSILGINIYRVSYPFLTLLQHENTIISKALSALQLQYDTPLTYNNVLERIPFTIHNSHLANLFILSCDAMSNEIVSSNAARLDVTPSIHFNPIIDTLVSQGGVLEEYAGELDHFSRQTQSLARLNTSYKERYASITRENEKRQRSGLGPLPLPEAPKNTDPSLLPSYLLANRIEALSCDLENISTQAYVKQSALKSLLDKPPGQ